MAKSWESEFITEETAPASWESEFGEQSNTVLEIPENKSIEPYDPGPVPLLSDYQAFHNTPEGQMDPRPPATSDEVLYPPDNPISLMTPADRSYTQQYNDETVLLGKQRKNDDGTTTTVLSKTAFNPVDGKWYNVPGFDRVSGLDYPNDDAALEAALPDIQAGLVQPYDTVEAATDAATEEHKELEGTDQSMILDPSATGQTPFLEGRGSPLQEIRRLGMIKSLGMDPKSPEYLEAASRARTVLENGYNPGALASMGHQIRGGLSYRGGAAGMYGALGDAAAKLADLAGNKIDPYMDPVKKAATWLQDAGSQNAIAAAYDQIMAEKGRPGGLGGETLAALAAVPDMGMTIVLTALTKNPNIGLSAMGIQVAADTYGRERYIEGKDEGAAAWSALKEAAWEVAPEKMFGVLEPIASKLPIWQTIIKTAIAEAPSEMVTEGLSILDKSYETGKAPSWLDQVIQLSKAGYAGGVMGLAMGGGGAVVNSAHARLNQNEYSRKFDEFLATVADETARRNMSPSGGQSASFDEGFNAADELLNEQGDIDQLATDLDSAFSSDKGTIPLLDTLPQLGDIQQTQTAQVSPSIGPNIPGIDLMNPALDAPAAETPGAEPTGQLDFPAHQLDEVESISQQIRKLRQTSGRKFNIEIGMGHDKQTIPIDTMKDDILTTLAKRGGLNRDSWISEGIDPEVIKDKKLSNRIGAKTGIPFGKPLMRATGGMTVEDVAEFLRDERSNSKEGFAIPPEIYDQHGNVSANDALQFISEVISGRADGRYVDAIAVDNQIKELEGMIGQIEQQRADEAREKLIPPEHRDQAEREPAHDPEYYPTEWDSSARTLADWMAVAEEAGVDSEVLEMAALKAHTHPADAVKELLAGIQEIDSGRQETTTDRAGDPGARPEDAGTGLATEAQNAEAETAGTEATSQEVAPARSEQTEKPKLTAAEAIEQIDGDLWLAKGTAPLTKNKVALFQDNAMVGNWEDSKDLALQNHKKLKDQREYWSEQKEKEDAAIDRIKKGQFNEGDIKLVAGKNLTKKQAGAIYKDKFGGQSYAEGERLWSRIGGHSISNSGITTVDSEAYVEAVWKALGLKAEKPADSTTQAASATFEEMVAQAARWKGAAMKVAQTFDTSNKEGRRAALKHSRATNKADLDKYLMTKYGIDEVTARDVSNELTAKNIPNDMSAEVSDFASESWATTEANNTAKPKRKSIVMDEVPERLVTEKKQRDELRQIAKEFRELGEEGLADVLQNKADNTRMAVPEDTSFNRKQLEQHKRAALGNEPAPNEVDDWDIGRYFTTEREKKVLEDAKKVTEFDDGFGSLYDRIEAGIKDRVKRINELGFETLKVHEIRADNDRIKEAQALRKEISAISGSGVRYMSAKVALARKYQNASQEKVDAALDLLLEELGDKQAGDLLGQDVSKEQSLADLQRQKDEKRSGRSGTETVPMEAGAGDLFGGQQTPDLFAEQQETKLKDPEARQKAVAQSESETSNKVSEADTEAAKAQHKSAVEKLAFMIEEPKGEDYAEPDTYYQVADGIDVNQALKDAGYMQHSQDENKWVSPLGSTLGINYFVEVNGQSITVKKRVPEGLEFTDFKNTKNLFKSEAEAWDYYLSLPLSEGMPERVVAFLDAKKSKHMGRGKGFELVEVTFSKFDDIDYRLKGRVPNNQWGGTNPQRIFKSAWEKARKEKGKPLTYVETAEVAKKVLNKGKYRDIAAKFKAENENPVVWKVDKPGTKRERPLLSRKQTVEWTNSNDSNYARLDRSSQIYSGENTTSQDRNVFEVARVLHNEAIDVWGGDAAYTVGVRGEDRGNIIITPADREIIVENMLGETLKAYRHDPTAVEWYHENLAEAIEYAAIKYPELKTDKDAVTAFKFILAITSNGQRVNFNAQMTDRLYEKYRKTKRFSVEGSGKEKEAMKIAFEAANATVNRLGWDKFVEFLHTEYTVRELQDAGFAVNGENMETKLFGSAVFGPKVGGGFYQNLTGNYEPVTFDKWWMRTWGRHTGTLLPYADRMVKQKVKLRAMLSDNKATVYRHGYKIRELQKDDEKLIDFALKVQSEYAKSNFTDKTPLNKYSNTVAKTLEAIKEAPGNGSEREFMRSIVEDIQTRLADMGIDMFPADIQALLWYAEKDLYDRMGRATDLTRNDYASAWQEITGSPKIQRSTGGSADPQNDSTTGGRGSGKTSEKQEGQTLRSKANRAAPSSALSVEQVQSVVNQATTTPKASKIKVVNSISDINVPGLVPLMTAWHGTPHSFDKFSLDNIGGGEGAQAYGWGLYFAESKGLANAYRVNLSYDPSQMKVGGEQINDYFNRIGDRAARMPVKQARGEYEKLDLLERLMMNDLLSDVAEAAKEMSAETQKWFNKEVKPGFETYGNLYEVDIPDSVVEKMLDWDKPLAEQSQFVRDALNNLPERIWDDIENYATPAGYNAVIKDDDLYTAGEFYQAFAKAWDHDAEAVSDFLNVHGIPGIKYLDRASRTEGEGTRNFVVFDAENAKIQSRNGKPLPSKPLNSEKQGGIEGMYDPESDTIYLIADQFSDEDRVKWVTWHELWHRGARVAFGDHLDSTLRNARTNPFVNRLANKVYQDRKFGDDVKAGEFTEDRAQLIATDEALAELDAAAQTGDFSHIEARYKVKVPAGLQAGWRKVLADWIEAVKRIFNKIGISNQEVRSILNIGSEASGGDMPGRGSSPAMASEGNSKDPFYSALTETVEAAQGMPKKASPEHFKKWLDGQQSKGNLKKEERDWLGLDEWLDSKESVTRTELQQFVRDNQVSVVEVVKSGNNLDNPYGEYADPNALASSVKFATYTLPGGENYRELLLTLPRRNPPIGKSPDYMEILFDEKHQQDYQSGHYDEPNILAHIRFNERKGANGERILFIEEIQSDWHQAGRKGGYKDDNREEAVKELEELNKIPEGKRTKLQWKKIHRAKNIAYGSPVPGAPFKKSWPMLAMKRMLRYATENGFDSVAWTTGEQQAERYDLSKKLDRIEYQKNEDAPGLWGVFAYSTDGAEVVAEHEADLDKIEEIFGKEIADKVQGGEGQQDRGGATVEKDPHDDRWLVKGPNGNVLHYDPSEAFAKMWANDHNAQSAFTRLTGLDLKVGGEGMRSFYDRTLVNETNKFVKKWGGKVKETAIGGGAYELRDGMWLDPHQTEVEEITNNSNELENKFIEWMEDNDFDPDLWGNPDDILAASEDLTPRQEGFLRDLSSDMIEENESTTWALTDGEGYIHEGGFATHAEAMEEYDRRTTKQAKKGSMDKQPGLEITDQMREAIRGGVPMFSKKDGGNVIDFPKQPERLKPYTETKKSNIDYDKFIRDNDIEVMPQGDTRAKDGKIVPDFVEIELDGITASGDTLEEAVDDLIGKFERGGGELEIPTKKEKPLLSRAPLKPTIANVKKLGGDRFGWLTFKNRLGEELGMEGDPAKWDVPKEWRDAWQKANGKFGEGPFAKNKDKRTSPFSKRTKPLESRAPELDFNPDFSAWSLPTLKLAEAMKDDSLSTMDKALKGTENLRLNARQHVQDKMIPMRRIQEAIEKTGGLMSDFSNVYDKEQLLAGRVEDSIKKMEGEDLAPLVSWMNKHGVSRETLGKYLYARHAEARNDRIAGVNANFPDGGSGMSTKEAKRILADFDQQGLTPALKKMAGYVDRITNKTRNNFKEYGLINSEVIKDWEKPGDFNDTYVPLRGFADAIAEEFGRPGKGFDIRGQESRRALGRKSEPGDIIGNVLSAYKLSVIRGEKNRIGQALLKLAIDNPNPNLWKVNPVKMKTVIDKKTGMTKEVVDLMLNDPNVFYTKVKGKAYRIELRDPRLAIAMKNLGADNMGAIMRGLSTTTRYLSMTRTMLSPEFIVTNFMRDIQTAAINLTGEQAKAIRKTAISRKSITHSMRAMFNEQRDGSKGDPVWRRYAREYTEDGGRVAFFRAESVEELARKVDRMNKMAGKGAGKAMFRGLKATFEMIEDLNLAVENATRLSAYKAARENGMSRQKAAVLAKNLTVNFNRKGLAGPQVNALYMFANASMQGAQRMLQASKNPRVQKVLLASALFGTLMTVLNQLSGGDDDDGESFYSKIPPFEKSRKFILMIPQAMQDYVKDLPFMKFVDKERKRGAYLSFHLPYGYSVPYVIGEAIGSTAFGTDPADAGINILLAINNSFNPVGGSNAWTTAAPTLADPFIELILNRNFWGGPIHQSKNPWDDSPAPNSSQGWRNTNAAYKYVAKKLNEWSGGNEARPGAVDLHPETYRHFLEFATGGTGSFVERVIDNVSAAVSPKREVDINRVPFVRQFFGTTRDFADVDRYYSNVAEMEYLKDEDKLFMEKVQKGEMRQDRYDQWKEDRKDLFDAGLIGEAKSAEKAIAKLRKHLKKEREQDPLSETAKQLEKDILDRQRAFNKSFNDVMLDKGWLRSIDLPAPAPAKETTESGVSHKTVEQVAGYEQFSGKAYKRPGDAWTVGFGTNIEEPHAKAWLVEIGKDPAKLIAGKQTISKPEATILLHKGLDLAAEDARKLFDNFDLKPEPVKRILTDMSYNLGYNRLKDFSNFRKAVDSEDYKEAAWQMRYTRTKAGKVVNTPWYLQTGRRSRYLTKLMENQS